MFIDRQLQSMAAANSRSPAAPPGCVEAETEHARRVELALEQAEEIVAPLLERGVAQCMERLDEQLAKRLLETLFGAANPDEGAEAPVLSDEDFGRAVGEALDLLLAGDDDRAVPLLTLLLALRPDDPRPLVGLMTAVWRTDGVSRAAEIYLQITEQWADPELDYFAADCMQHAGWRDEADITLSRGIRELQSLSPRCESDELLLDQMFSLQQEIARD